MTPDLLRSLLSAFVLAFPVVAQRVWVVAEGGGPGVDFTDVPPAIAAAGEGDVILIRPGDYGPAHIDGKSLTVAGEAGVRVDNLLVSNLAPTQRAVVIELEVLGLPFLFTGARDARGTVLFERVKQSQSFFTPAFSNCADVRLSHCEYRRIVTITGSVATITDSQLDNTNFAVGGQATLTAVNSTVTLSRCRVFGLSELLRAAAAPAIAMQDSTVVATDDGTNAIAAGSPQWGPQPSAVVGTGTFIRDPAMLVAAGTAPPVSGPVEIVRLVPSLRTEVVRASATVEVDLSGAAGEAFALVVGLPGLPVPLPHLGGSVGLSTLLVVAQGAFGSAPFHLSVPLGTGVPPGFTLAWQAVAGNRQGGFQLSNVATYARER